MPPKNRHIIKMKINILKKILILTLTLIILFTMASRTFAESKNELNSQSKEIDSKIADAKDQLSDIQDAQSENLQAVEKLIAEISEYENEIEELDTQIENLKQQISENEQQIQEKEAEYQKQDELLKKRLIVMYESGNTSYLEVLLSSKNIADFLSKYYLLAELAQQDNKLLDEIQKSKEEIENKKKELEDSKKQVEDAQAEKKSKAAKLKESQKEKEEYASKLDEQEKQAQKELETFQKDKDDITNKLKKIAEEEKKAAEEAARKKAEEEKKKNNSTSNSSNSGSKSNAATNNSSSSGSSNSSSGYISPIAGLTKSNITCGYYGYATHTGVDFGGNYGKAVLAVKDGTVITSEARTGNIPNYSLTGTLIGYYRSYGEYIIINHHDGTMTLYAHGKPGSRLVKEGDTVKQGQQIMSVGNTGNVLPRPSASTPTRGAHLHFEVRKYGVPVNPTSYLP